MIKGEIILKMLDFWNLTCSLNCGRETLCQWIACNSVLCFRKSLTCITRGSVSHCTTSSKLPKINLSFNNNKRSNNSESCRKINKSASVNSETSAIVCKLCNSTLNRIEYKECHLIRRCCNLKSPTVCNKILRTQQVNSIYFGQRSCSHNSNRFYFLIFLLFITFMSVTANELSVETDVAFKNKSDGEYYRSTALFFK